MPIAAKKPCLHPACGRLVTGGYCEQHQIDINRERESRRGSATERGYNHKWRKARETFLRRSPLCVFCSAKGLVVVATVVDHIVPHKGDSELFWDSSNWQSLCKPCHDSDKQRQEVESSIKAWRDV